MHFHCHRKPIYHDWVHRLEILSVLVAWGETASGNQPPAAMCRVSNAHQGHQDVGSGTLIDKTADSREGLVLTCAYFFSRRR